MKKSKISGFIVMIVIFSLFVIGAQQQGCNQKQKGPVFNATGLILSFQDNMPPSTINLGTQFQIYVKAENHGSYNIETGTAKFYLTGVGNNLRNVNSVLSNQNKITKETQQQEGGFEIIKFAENAEPSIQVTNPFNFSIKADACYPYATQTQVTVCIGQGIATCSISGEKITTGSNTNAPIQITSLTEQTQGNRLYISFIIENRGTGSVYYSNLNCDKLYGQDASERNRELAKKNYVEVYVDTGTEADIKCNLLSTSGSGIEGVSGMVPIGKKVTCYKTIGQESYPAVLKINQAYKYIDGTSKQLTILP